MTPAQREMQILRKYAQGGSLTDVARACDVDLEVVSGVVSAVGFQRGRAAELLRQREAALTRRSQVSQPAVRLASVPRPSTPTSQESTVQPTNKEPGSVEQLLDRAAKTESLRARVVRIRALLAELRNELPGAEAVTVAAREVERLRTELEAATGRLRQLTKPTAADADRPADRDVRAWAMQQGIDVPAGGRVKGTLVEQYLAAQTGQVAA
jgi:hypothetical protein